MKMAHSSGWETTSPSPAKATTGGTRRGQGYQEAEAGRPGYKCHPRGRCKTRPVIDLLRFVFGLAADLVRRRVELVADNALLRQQLIVAKRKVAGRVRWTPWQRFTIVPPRESRQLGVKQPCSSARWRGATRAGVPS